MKNEKTIPVRDETHDNFIERRAAFMKMHPKTWKKYHTTFINAPFDKAYHVIGELAKTKEGQQKIVEMYRIKNVKGYPELLKDLQ